MIYNLNLCCRFPSWVDIDLSQKRRCGPELLRSSPSHFRVSDANWWNTFHKSKHHSYLINTYILFCYPLFTHDFSFSISSNVYLYKKKDTFIFMFSFFFCSLFENVFSLLADLLANVVSVVIHSENSSVDSEQRSV